MTGDPIVVVTNDRVVERAAVGIAWKAVTRLVIATKRRRLIIMLLDGRRWREIVLEGKVKIGVNNRLSISGYARFVNNPWRWPRSDTASQA